MCLLFRYIFTLNNKLINSMLNWRPKYNLIGGHVKPLVPRLSDREGAGPIDVLPAYSVTTVLRDYR